MDIKTIATGVGLVITIAGLFVFVLRQLGIPSTLKKTFVEHLDDVVLLFACLRDDCTR